jgi:tetratricopeptide (TPR) repeat protein
MAKLDAHHFHPWEGGEGKVPAQYQLCRVELAKQAMVEDRFIDAIRLLEECLVYPHHLGEGKLHGAQEQDFYYWLGCAWQGADNPGKAVECWEKASKGDLKPVPALYYNDAKPEKIYYQGLALAALGRTAEAEEKFRMLLEYGQEHRNDQVVMDYFAVSLPDLAIWDEDLTLRNVAHCDLMTQLGRDGLYRIGK